MKKVLSVILLVSSALVSQAQGWEFGIHGGISSNGNPSDNMPYKGNTSTLNYDGHLTLVYHLSKYFQVGLEGRIVELSRISDSVYTSPYNIPIGDDGKKMVYAKHMLSGAVIANGQISLGSGYVYGGAALGYGVSLHRTRKLNESENYRTPNGGRGIMYGGQLGYVLPLSKYVGLNIEGAVRYYTLYYKDNEVPNLKPETNLDFNVMSYSGTLGLRFRLPSRYERGMNMPPFGGARR